MKKVLLTAMALLTIASASAFGMYGDNSDWIDFLVHGNQFRARMNQLGFTLGNGTIKGTFGFKNDGGLILNTSSVTPTDDNYSQQESKRFYNFNPVVSAGIGYTTEAFGIGIGYNYRYVNDKKLASSPVDGTVDTTGVATMTKNGYGLSVHTPVVAFNALNNNLRIVVPIQVAVKNNDRANPAGASDMGFDYKNHKYLGLSMDPQIRYYPGLDFLTEFRLYVKYGMNQYSYNKENASTGKYEVESFTASSFGFDFRAYFAAQVGDVGLAPFIKIAYDTALDKEAGDYDVKSYDGHIITKPAQGVASKYDSNPWQLVVLPTLGLSANSDFVSLYLEAALGYKAVNTGYNYDRTKGGDRADHTKSGILHSLAWKAYGEVYVTPVKDLEWYFEAEIGNDVAGSGAKFYYTQNPNDPYALNGFNFATSTGITWYLPSLNGAE